MKKTRKEIKREACIQLKYLIDEYINAEGKEDMKIDISIKKENELGDDYDIDKENSTLLKDAVDTLRFALTVDEEYAYTWQANLAMCFYDAYVKVNDVNSLSNEEESELHMITNNAAIDFLEKLKVD